MPSKYIRKPERIGYQKGRVQKVKTLVKGVILPVYRSRAYAERKKNKLPKTFERNKKETVLEFRARVMTESAKYMRTHIKWVSKERQIQHLVC